jgi:hypothetical protein
VCNASLTRCDAVSFDVLLISHTFQTELLDEFTPGSEHLIANASGGVHEADVGMGNATFTWTSDIPDGTATPSRQLFRLRIEKDLIFKQNAINLIVGPTGCGKTSLLMALLGELHYIPSGPGAWVNLPRSGGVSYAAQESWIQNETIRVSNIQLNLSGLISQ